ncbi:molybdopterin-guanine dinucleotide biosynthesis protein B [Bacillus vallismortis]|uniref:molybdopterin-guanine dinucleotide biosynthesis protein B n=1 Tax=Bacillus vallismortis TaxID=72361 RepID=UPI002281D864|nr:molybdopterin-guanine dinucleotide biosynthesis protein B [Bacillus vallismortis]MCY8544402.1 molybdopterin-guanine dinucleotide biosynthesis protein B [Bacillus vallismortis]
MALVRPFPIVQVVGFQNSGKTTFIERILEKSSEQGLNLGCLKHHGHGGEPQTFTNGKDTDRYQAAGADVTVVEGAGVLQLTARRHWDLPRLIGLYQFLETDCLLIEGFKKAPYPKVVILSEKEDLEALQADNTIAIIYRKKEHITEHQGLSVFHADDPAAVDFVLSQLKGESA